jgi:hypothetical protein
MYRSASITLLLSLALLWGCSRTMLVEVPPRMELNGYGTLGIVEFASNSDPAINAQATRKFQEQVQAAQPGTRFIELGSREAVLAAVGGTRLDPQTLARIGMKYGVAAVFLGDIVYSDPKTDFKMSDLSSLKLRSEVKGDISSRLLETGTGASIWSSSAWATRQVGRLNVSAGHGVHGETSDTDPRAAMMPALVYQLTHDFRPSTVRQRAP